MVLADRLTSWFSPSLQLKLKNFSSAVGTSLTVLGRSSGEEQTAATVCLCTPWPPTTSFSHLNFAIDKWMENQVHWWNCFLGAISACLLTEQREKKRFPYRQSCAFPGPFLWLPALPLSWIAGAALLYAGPSHWTVLISSDRAPLSWKIPPAVSKHHRMIVWGKCLLALSLDLWVHLGRCGSHSSLPVQVCQQVGFYCKFGGKGVMLSKNCFSHISGGVLNYWNDDHMAGSLCLLNL